MFVDDYVPSKKWLIWLFLNKKELSASVADEWLIQVAIVHLSIFQARLKIKICIILVLGKAHETACIRLFN